MRSFYYILVAFLILSNSRAAAQSSDSLIVRYLQECGVTFSQDNSVTLLNNGLEKFDDLFKAIMQAKSSVHL